MLERLAEQPDLPCRDGAVVYDLPAMDLKLLQLKDIRAEQDGFVLQFGMVNPLS
jgi:hypothetical protein